MYCEVNYCFNDLKNKVKKYVMIFGPPPRRVTSNNFFITKFELCIDIKVMLCRKHFITRIICTPKYVIGLIFCSSYLCLNGCIANAEHAGEARESIQTLLTVCADLCGPFVADVVSLPPVLT